MQDNYIPFFRHSLTGEEIKSVAEVMRSPWLTMGPVTRKFEEAFAVYVNSKYSLAVNSCTAALHLSLLAHNISGNDEVIVPSFTFAATANVVVNVGAKPVFADIEEKTLCLDPVDVAKKLTDRTRAIILVHYGGRCAPVSEIKQIAKQARVTVIEDAAHALGAKYKGKMVGGLGNTTAFSFYATKNLTTAEGGMLTTDKLSVYKRASILRLHGLNRGAWKRYLRKQDWQYKVLAPGFKYNMTDIQAAIGLTQLKKFSALQKKRREIASLYLEGLSGLPGVILPNNNIDSGNQLAWHLFPIRLVSRKAAMSRDRFIEEMSKNGIGTSVHFLPLHLQPFYRKHLGTKSGQLPVTEKVSREIVSLPLYPDLKNGEVNRIITTVKKLLICN